MQRILIVGLLVVVASAGLRAPQAQADTPPAMPERPSGVVSSAMGQEAPSSPEKNEGGHDAPSASQDGESEGDTSGKSDPGGDCQGDKCASKVREAAALSDPVTILRFAVAPIVLWIIKNLVSYSFQRIHMARAIYVDVEYRLLFARGCIDAGRQWLQDFDVTRPEIPVLNIDREEHRLYVILQPDLRECTWGAEVAAIRLAYRSFDEIESIAGRIAKTYAELLTLSRSLSQQLVSGRNQARIKRHSDLIASDIDRIERIYLFWLQVSRRARRQYPNSEFAVFALYVWCCRNLLPEKVFRAFCRLYQQNSTTHPRWIARSLLYNKWLWHLMCVYVPLAVLLLLGYVVVFSGFDSDAFDSDEMKTVYFLFLAELVIYSVWRRAEEFRIETCVLGPMRLQIKRHIKEKIPPTYV